MSMVYEICLYMTNIQPVNRFLLYVGVEGRGPFCLLQYVILQTATLYMIPTFLAPFPVQFLCK